MTQKFEITLGPLKHPYRCVGCLTHVSSRSEAHTPQTIYLVIYSIDETSIVGDKRIANNYCYFCSKNILGQWMQTMDAYKTDEDIKIKDLQYLKNEKQI